MRGFDYMNEYMVKTDILGSVALADYGTLSTQQLPLSTRHRKQRLK
jgi:hypothetical protein